MEWAHTINMAHKPTKIQPVDLFPIARRWSCLPVYFLFFLFYVRKALEHREISMEVSENIILWKTIHASMTGTSMHIITLSQKRGKNERVHPVGAGANKYDQEMTESFDPVWMLIQCERGITNALSNTSLTFIRSTGVAVDFTSVSYCNNVSCLTVVFWHCMLVLLNLRAGTLCVLPWMWKMHS